MSREQATYIRNRAEGALRSLRDQGFDRATIMSFAAELLGQLTNEMRDNAGPPSR